jgi:two-component system chemotaxis sensor kinase CheA
MNRDAIAEAAMLLDPADNAARQRLAALFSEAIPTLVGAAQAAAREAALLLSGNPPADLLDRLGRLTDAALAEAPPPPQAADPAAVRDFLTRAANEPDELAALVLAWDGGDDEAKSELRRRLHTLKGDAGVLGLHDLQALMHRAEDLVLTTTRVPVPELLAACTWAGEEISHLAGGPAPGPAPRFEATPPPAQLGELLIASGAVRPESVVAALAEQAAQPTRRLGEVLVDSGAAHPKDVSAALAAQRAGATPHHPAATPSAPTTSASQLAPATLRVEVERVDALAEAVGELGIAQAMLANLLGRTDRRTASLLARIDRLLRSAQDASNRLRMVPVRPVFQRAERAARELAARLGKPIAIHLVGAGTELDKAVAERLGDPLLHLVRNALDHGIEDAAGRAAAGKPATATLTIAAERHDGRVVVSVADDGRGLDRARILARARERGLSVPHDQTPDGAVWELLCQSGFSTAEKVTDISGRGVGLDVVRSAVHGMRGRLEITAQPGAGACFTVILPPTLVAVDGLGLLAGGQRFVIPTSAVRACLRPRPGDLDSVAGRGWVIPHQGRLLPWRPLPDLLGLAPLTSKRPLAVVVDDGARQAAIAVDAILGRTAAVLKPLAGLPDLAGVVGTAIGADGRVDLVLDPVGLLSSADLSVRKAS